MTNHPPVCIHLGLPKTATTSIRFNLFAQHSQAYYLGKFLGGELPPAIRHAILERWTIQDKTLTPSDIRNQSVRKQLDYATEKKLTPILSMESLAGGPLWKKKLQAQRFKKTFGECKIILFAREPVSFLNSFYAQMLRNFQERQSNHKKNWMNAIGEAPLYFDANEWLQATWKRINSPANFIRYADTASTYARVFGRENVHVFLFEEFVQTPEAVITKLCDTIGIAPEEGFRLVDGKRSNERLTTDYIHRIQEIRQSEKLAVQFRAASPIERRQLLESTEQHGKRITPQLSEKWLKKIHAVGNKQNRRLVREWGVPLNDYGYRV